MFTIYDECGRFGRRKLLSIGGLGLARLLFPLSSSRASAAEEVAAVTGKSVIFLFQQGGPSQLETFDPKPDAPLAIRTVTDTVPTALPGVRFAEPMSRLAKLADKFAVVRSFQTNNGGHNIQPLVGPDSLDTNIGVHFSRVAGASHPQTGTPSGAVLFPRAVNPDVPGPEARGEIDSTGSYPRAFAPFVPGAGGQFQENMKLNLPRGRFDNRRGILQQLDRLQRRLDADAQLGTLDELRQQAYRLLEGGGVSAALDLSLEDPKVVARYDTSQYARAGRWDKVNRGKKGYYTAQAATIGKLLLVARRLCEAGCGFVTVHAGYAGVWDMHADGNNLNMRDGMEAVGRSYDHAVAALVEDLEARGLRDQILLASTGEMGRTPKINNRGGRDHWGRLAPLLLYGSGVPGGQVIGSSTRDGGEPATDAFGPRHLISTMLRTVLDLGQLRLATGVPPQVMQLIQEPPIAGLR